MKCDLGHLQATVKVAFRELERGVRKTVRINNIKDTEGNKIATFRMIIIVTGKKDQSQLRCTMVKYKAH